MDPSTKKLIAALELKPQSFTRDTLIRRARKNCFHDFKSTSATPVQDLVKQLQAAGYHDLAKLAMQGEFDATKEEADAWAQTAEAREIFKEFK